MIKLFDGFTFFHKAIPNNFVKNATLGFCNSTSTTDHELEDQITSHLERKAHTLCTKPVHVGLK
jgi:hypothetical protein